MPVFGLGCVSLEDLNHRVTDPKFILRTTRVEAFDPAWKDLDESFPTETSYVCSTLMVL